MHCDGRGVALGPGILRGSSDGTWGLPFGTGVHTGHQIIAQLTPAVMPAAGTPGRTTGVGAVGSSGPFRGKVGPEACSLWFCHLEPPTGSVDVPMTPVLGARPPARWGVAP